MKIKIDPTKVMGIAIAGMGLATTLLTNIVDKNNRKTMKDEITKEVIEELSKK